MEHQTQQMNVDEWMDKGKALYGENVKDWKFRCTHCGEVQTGREFEAAEIEDPENKVYFSCIGRWVDDRGCDWTLGGLFKIHKREVITDNDTIPVFLFADEDPEEIESEPKSDQS